MRRPTAVAVCFAVVVCFAVALAAARLPAEVFLLKSGGRIEAEQLNRERERGQPYQLKAADGVRLALAESAVLRVIVKSDLDKQYEALVEKLDNSVASHWNIAEWCLEVGLTEQRKRHLAAIIALEPNHEEARKALGYQRFGTRWLTQEERMQTLGYVKYKGAWRIKQEIEILNRQEQEELATKKLRKDIRLWLDQVASGGRLADQANRSLNAIQEPAAAPALAEVLGDPSQPPATRKRCLSILTKLPTTAATPTLVRVAQSDPDSNLQDACLDLLKQQGPHLVVSYFVRELHNKDNAALNHAADCLARLGDKSATLALINALVTEQKFQVSAGGGPGSINTAFGSGGGTFSSGKTAMVQKKLLENSSVRSALTSMYPGVNYNYDIGAWRAWYVKTQTTSDVNLRRDE